MRSGMVITVLLAFGCGERAMPPGDDAGIAGDAGGPAEDAGADAGAPMCAEDLRAPFAQPPCSTETRECARACDSASCAEDCFLADPDFACIQCWTVNQIACWNRNGCQAQWNCVAQCIQTHCPEADPACVGEHCAAEDIAYGECFEPLVPTCLERTIDCLPE